MEEKKNEQYVTNRCRIDFLYWIYVVCMYTFCFQDIVKEKISFVKYWDEIFALFVVVIMPFWVSKISIEGKRVKAKTILIVWSICLFCLLGIGTSYYYSYQSIKMVCSEVLVMSKYFFSIAVAYSLFFELDLDRIKLRLQKHLRIITVIYVVMLIMGIIQNLLGKYVIQILLTPFRLAYVHETFLVAACVFVLIHFFLMEKNTINIICIFVNISFLILTTKSKAYLAVLLVGVCFYWILHKGKKIKLAMLVPLGIISLPLVWNKLIKYFVVYANTARAVVAQYSFKIANDYFPLGSGFATFASHFSSVEYSPIYAMYGIENVEGLIEGRAAYVSDNFWPMILGEFGYLGLFIYAFILFMLYLQIQEMYTWNKKMYCAALISIGYLLIASTAESAFFNSYAPMYGMVLGVVLANFRKGKKRKIEQ